MTVKELREVLSDLPDDLPIGVHANNHDYFSHMRADGLSHGMIRVVLCRHYVGNHILIGNMSKRNLNPPNWVVLKEVDGGPRLPDNWSF